MRSFKFSCLAFASVLSLVHYSQSARAELPASVVDRLKTATVFVKTASKEGTSQGTGFFIENNLIVTNAHVLGIKDQWQIYSGTVEVVLRSGMTGEQSIDCTISGVDSGRDLAFLKVPTQNGIEPIRMVSSTEVTETLPIYVLGYPLGDRLDRSGKNPALSFATGRVSSIRRDANEDLESIQVDASLVPGNSGGPIVDSKGELVGVAVSTVLGTNIGFSIPADAVKEDLQGKICGLALTQSNTVNGPISVSVKTRTVDPFKRIKQTAIYYWTSKLNAKRPVEPKLKYAVHGAPEDGPRRYIRLERETTDDLWSGQINDVSIADDEELWVQLAVADENGVRLIGAVNHTRDYRKREKENREKEEAERLAKEALKSPLLRQLIERFKPRKIASEVNVKTTPTHFAKRATSESGENSQDDSELESVPRFIVLNEKRLLEMVADPKGDRLYAIFEGDSNLWIYNTEDFSLESKVSVARLPVSIWCDADKVVVACDRSRVVQFVDTRELVVKHSARVPEKDLTAARVVGNAPDGSLMTIWNKEEDGEVTSNVLYLVDEEHGPMRVVEDEFQWCSFPIGPSQLLLQSDLHPTSPWIRMFEVKPKIINFQFRYKDTIGPNNRCSRAFLTSDHKYFLLPLLSSFEVGKSDENITLFFKDSLGAPVFHAPGMVISENSGNGSFVTWRGEGKNVFDAQVVVHYINPSSGEVRRRIRMRNLSLEEFGDIETAGRNTAFVPGRELFIFHHRNKSRSSAKGEISVFPCSQSPKKL